MVRKYIDYKPLSALEIDRINRTTPDLSPEEQAIHDQFVIEEYV